MGRLLLALNSLLPLVSGSIRTHLRQAHLAQMRIMCDILTAAVCWRITGRSSQTRPQPRDCRVDPHLLAYAPPTPSRSKQESHANTFQALFF